MDLYHSRLTQDDLNDLIIKYKIPHDLHPRLPSEEFVMSKLLDDAIDRADVCVDDNRFCMKNWKNGFFLIDRRAILDSMVWRHPSAAIDDPRPVTDSFSMADVHRLSAHVINLRDMPDGVLVLSGLSRVWKSRVYDPVLQGADGNVMGIHDFLCLLELTGSETLIKQTLLQALLVLRFFLRPRLTRSKRPLLLVPPRAMLLSALGDDNGSDDDDDDACVEIPLVNPLCSAARDLFFKEPGWKFCYSRYSQGKGIMADDAAASFVSVSRPRLSSSHAPSFRDVSGDAIHADFFPFFAGPYYATYPEGGVVGNCEFTREEWDAPYRPTFGVLTKEVFKDPTICKTVVDQFPTPGDANSRLKGYEEKVASLTGLELQVYTLKKKVFRLDDKLSSSDASFAKSKAKGKERKKKIKSLTKSLDN
ncbi:hypothetical protein Tco_1216520 [Tanacetum coccineum]